MDVAPDGITKLELGSSVIVKIENNVDISTNIETETDEYNIPSRRIKQELESPGNVNTENESDENISTRNIKIERDQAIENQINKILGTIIKEEPDLNEELTTDYMVNLECLPKIKTEELMLKSESGDSGGGSYNERRAFNKHRKNSIEKYDCHHCDYTSRHKDHLVRHISVTRVKNSVKEYGHDVGNHKANREDNLARHILVNHEGDSDKEHVCYICEYTTYLKKYTLVNHEHGCDFCDYRFLQKEDLDLHILARHDNSFKKHGCDFCDYRSNQKHNLKLHILNRHSNSATKEYACDVCNYETHSKRNLKDHIMFKHNKKPNKEHGCDICGYRAHWKRSLKRHMLIKHSNNSLEKFNRPEETFTATEVGFKPQK